MRNSEMQNSNRKSDAIRTEDIKVQPDQYAENINGEKEYNNQSGCHISQTHKQESDSAGIQCKLPHVIKNALIEKSRRWKNYKQSSTQHHSENAVKAAQKSEQRACTICRCMFDSRLNAKKLTNCSHLFCQNCISAYVKYKIMKHERVCCPQENCSQQMDRSSFQYANLPIELKTDFDLLLKIGKDQTNSKQFFCSTKRCFQQFKIQDSDGALPQSIYCDRCENSLCLVCHLPFHRGHSCEQSILSFFNKTLCFQVCPDCMNKSYLQKKLHGSIHMMCTKCEKGFCFICGQNYLSFEHKCNPDGKYLFDPELDEDPLSPLCQCWCCYDSIRCHRACIKCALAPLKVLLSLIWSICCVMLLVYALFSLVIFILVGFFLGLCTCVDFINDTMLEGEQLKGCLMLIFFPFTILYRAGFMIKETIPVWVNFAHRYSILNIKNGFLKIWMI